MPVTDILVVQVHSKKNSDYLFLVMKITDAAVILIYSFIL